MGNYFWAWVNGRGLAWHDQLSATVVIRVPVDPRQKRGIFGWFSKDDEQSTVNSQQSTVNSQQSTVNMMRSATGIDITCKSTV